jgi:hypothetical protein
MGAIMGTVRSAGGLMMAFLASTPTTPSDHDWSTARDISREALNVSALGVWWRGLWPQAYISPKIGPT